jgi:hypothetical protein
MNDPVPLLDHGSLPAVASAPLPATYEAAKRALEQCVALDECKMWANRAEALASYARQANDDALLKMSMRVQARAIDRCGELVREIKPAKNQHDVDASGGAPTGRFQAARRAGLSRDQTVTALRVNNVPRDEFERLVESDDPPTVTKLAELGTTKHEDDPGYLKGREPDDFAAATPFIGLAKEFLSEAQEIDLDRVHRGLNEAERAEARANYQKCAEWITNAWEVLDGLQSR